MSEAPESISLHDLITQAGNAVKMAMPSTYWVRAEVLSVKTRGATYVELSSYEGDGEAKATATIWKSQSKVISTFEAKSSTKLAKGLNVLVRVKVAIHPKYGLSINIHEIDGNFSRGDMESRLNEIRAQLTELNEIHLNKELASPLEFTRVAVVAPGGAAGLGDFQSVSTVLESRGLCDFTFYDALFQGEGNEQSIRAAIVNAVNDHEVKQYDALCIIRGGGGKSDLYELNKRVIARCVCRCPMPVFSGIGHEQDSTIIDELANTAFATPSLLITHIKQTIVQNCLRATKNYNTIRTSSSQLIQHARSECDSTKNVIMSLATRSIGTAKESITENRHIISSVPREQLQRSRFLVDERLGSIKQLAVTALTLQKAQVAQNILDLTRVSKTTVAAARQTCDTRRKDLLEQAENHIYRARSKVESEFKTISLLDPERIMARGYSLVFDKDNQPIVNSADVDLGNNIQIRFRDGTLGAEVTEKTNE